MSSQNAKKRRLGSRRVAPSQSEVPKADKYHLTDASSVAQDYAVEESTESLNVLSSQEDLKLETQHQPSAEVAFNRRKIGSNRRSKGKQLVDDLETEPYLNPEKELEEKSRGNETFKTIQTPRAVELKQQEEFSQGSDHVSALAKDYSKSTPDQNSEATKHSSEGVMEILTPKINNLQECNTCKNETKLEEIDKSDTQHEEIKGNMRPVAQQSSSDVPDEEPLTVYSVGEIQSTERDDTNLLRQDGRYNLVNESHVKFEALEAVTLNITTDENSPEKNIEVVFSVEQETFSSSKEKLTANEDPCSLSEVREEWQSEDSMNKIHEVNIKPIEIQDMYQNDYSSEIQGIDVTENADTCSGNPEDQTEMKDTHLSPMKVKNNNVFRTEQKDVNFNEKQYAHPTNDIHPECLEKENEDTQVYDSKQQMITDTAVSRLVATEMSNSYKSQLMVQTVDDSVSNNYKLSEQLRKERHLETLSEENEDSNVDMSNCSVQTLPSEVNTLLETHPVYDSIGKRRKMGSTRRNKGRQHDKEFKGEDAIGDETPETTEMSATETTRPEELLQGNKCDVPLSVPHDSSMFTVSTPAYSPEVQNPTTTSYPEISSSSLLIPQSEKRQDEQDFKVVSDKPLESGMEEVDESNTALDEEVKDANHSEETVRKMHEDEVEPTQIQEVLQNDFSSENVIDDATENSSMTSGNLSQTENSNTYQFQVMGQNPDESVTKVEVSTLDDKQAEHYFVTQENDEDAVVNSKNSGVSLQSVTSLVTTPFESQLQDSTMSTDKQTRAVTESRGHRRKMGSTRRNKGRQHDKEFKGEDAIGDETPETTEMSATETTRPEELLQGNECDVPLSVPHDSSMFAASTPAYSPEVQNPTTTSYPEISSSSLLIPQSEKRQDEQDFKVVSDKPLESGMEEVDESETALGEEVKDANHSEETVRKMHEDEVEPTQIQEVPRNDFSSENVIDDATENSSMTSGNLSQTENSNTYQFQVMGQNPDESVTKVEVSTLDDKQAEHYFVTQENEEDFAVDSKDGGVSLQSVTSLATTPFESQLQDSTVSTDKQTRAVTESRGHRRKMGSTRRNKGRQHDKEFKGEDAIGDETPETTEMSATETTRPEELPQGNECDVPLSVPHDSSMFTVSTPAYSPDVQNPTTTSHPEISSSSLLIPQSEKRQDEQDFKVVSDKPLESGMEEVDESNTALDEEVKDANHSEETVRKMHEDEVEPTQIQEVLQNDFSSENVIDDATENSSMTSGNLSQTENSNTYQFQVMGQNPDESVTKVEVSTLDDKQAEHYFVTQENDEDAVVNSKNSGVSLQSVTSLVTTPFESQLQDSTMSTDKQTRAVTESRGHRRKMGSTRRNKGRQHDKEFKDEDAIGDETPETTEMSATETTRPEELLQGNKCDVPLSVPHDSSMFTVSTPAYSPEVQNPTTTSYPEISSSSLIPQSEKRQDEQDFKVVSDKPLESGMEEMDESNTALCEEVKDANHSEETVRKMHEDEVEPTQIQEVLRNDFSSENVIDDATENSSMTSGNLSQTENSNTYQFQVMGQNPDESVTKVEVSTLDDKQAEHYFVTQENEEDFAVNSKDGGVSLQSVTSLATTPFESQLQDSTVSTDKQTHAVTESRGHRRKMGSTHRNKGRQHDKEFKSEDAIGDETPETTEMSATETTRPEELLQGNECDVPLSVPHDSSMFAASTPAYSPEVQNPTTTSYPEISSSSLLIPQSEKRQDEQDFKVVSDKPLESGMEEVDESETALDEEVKDANHSEETVRKMHEDEVEPTQIQEVLQNDFSSENVIDDATENSSMTSGNLSQTENSNTYQFQVMGQNPDESVTKVEVSTLDDKQAEHYFVTQENDEDAVVNSKNSGVSLQSVTSLVTTPFESQLQDGTMSTDKQTRAVTESRGHRRKMGSTRRNKGRQHDKEFKGEDAIGDETPETTEMSATETTRPEELLQGNECDVPLSVPHDSSMFTVSTPAYSPEVQNPTTTSYPEISSSSLLIPQSEKRQDEQDFKVVSDKPLESGMEEVDESETALDEEVKDANHSEETVRKMHEDEVEPTQIQEVPRNDFSSENVIDDATENSSMTSGNLSQTENSNTHQFQVMGQNPDESVTKVEVSTLDDKQAEHYFVTQENEEDFAVDSKDGGVSLQSVTSLATTPFESQLQEGTVSTDKQTRAVTESRGHRRKMGSTRRNKGRQHDKEFKGEDAIGDETPETTEMSATETTRPEELPQGNECDVPLSVPHDSSMFTVSTPAYSPEVQNPTTTSYPEISSSSLIPQSEKRQDEQDFKVVSDKPLESGMEEMDESETALGEEVKDANHSEETVRKMHEDEVEPTQIHEVLQNYFSSENVIDDATENSSMTSGNLSQTENSNTYQFQVMGQNPDESVTKVEVSTLDDKQAEHYFVTQENEEDFAVDSKDGGVSLQSVTSLATTPFESQLQDSTVSTDKQTRAVTESRGHRRKMGSTRRNKGRQHDKEFKGEDAIGDETPETTEMSATETTRPEELLQGNECDVPLSVPHDSSMFTVSTPAYSPEVQNPTTTSYPEISSSSLLIPQSEKRQDEQDFKVVSDKPLESGMEEVDESETALDEEVKDANHSEETVRKMHEDEVEPTQIQEVPRNDFSSENVIDDATENSSMTSGNLSQTENSNTYQFQVMGQNPDESVTKVEVSMLDDKQAGHHFVSQANMETDASDSKAAGVSLKSPHSISNPSFESHFQENIVSTSEQIHNAFDRGSRRKMGSSRRNNGRNRDKKFKDEETVGDEIPETAETSATVAKRPEELLKENKCDLSLSVPYSENSLENQNYGDSKVINDKPVEAGMEEVETDPHTKLLAQNGILPSNILLSGTECTISVEITTEKTSPRESTEVECSVAQEIFLASEDVLTANTEQHEHCNPTDKLHQTDYSSSTESHQTALSETNISSDFQHQDNSQNITEIQTGLSRTGNRKKMGSSRRNKGTQCVKDPDAYQEPIDDVLEKPTSNDKLRTVKISPATDITKEEEAKDLISVEKEMQISSAAKEGKNTEKLLEEDAFFSQNNKKDSNTNGLLKSNKDVNEENKVVQEAMNLDELTGCDTITKHLMQSPQASVCEAPSDMQHISYHGGIESSSSLKVLDKEEAFEAMEASNGQQEQTQSGNRNHLQINPKQKKRKIGSTRRSQLNRRKEEETDNTDETKESDFHTEADVRNIDKMDVGELPLTTDVPQNETAQPLFSAVHKQQEADEAFSEPSSTEINVIPVAEDFKAPLPEQSSSLREETISLVTCVNTGDVREVIVEPPQLDDFTNTETQMITVFAGRCRRSINQLLSPNTEAVTDTGIAEESLVSSSEARQNTYSNEERPESIKVVQDQDANEKNPNDLNEGAHNKTQEMRSESPNLNLSNRRRKISSTRRNLGSRNKEELHQKQEVDTEAKETGTDVGETESVPRIKEEALQLHTDRKDIDGEQRKQKLFETVEISPPGQSPFKPLPEQTVEERPVSQDQLAETEHHTANYLLSTSFKDDVVSESASGGRRRKLGSNRRSRGHQHTEDETGQSTIIDDQSGTDAKISEVGKSDKKPSSELSKSEEHSKTVSEKTSAQPCNAGIFLGKENQTLSLVNNPGVADPKSKRYNVVMIGDSSVGKTSFMKRAQSGKFSLDIPASIGLDSLMWPVVVDGKPMILQLWDTAGQERFHSITKQVFHKAQAFLLMYDITSTNSFSAVSYWANCIQESAAENVTVLLLGNKSDCSERRVKTHQGEILAKEYDFEFMECSAATGENVIQSLEVVARKLSQRIDSREEATVLHKEPEQKKSSRCC